MAENTKIEWATHSFSPFIGCSKVHVGCDHCYAAAMSNRLGVTWGPNGTRRRTAESTWKQVERWNRKAGLRISASTAALSNFRGGLARPLPGEIERIEAELWRPRVFPSLCDPFEDWNGQILGSNGKPIYVPLCERPQPNDPADHRQLRMADVRRDFFALIDRCPNLDFLLLTKRPENVRRMWFGKTPISFDRTIPQRRDNVWLLYSASDQASLEAGLPHLLACRDLVSVIGLSLEPLLGPIDLEGRSHGPISFCVVGGESGPRARPMEIAWLESIAEQCEDAGVALFCKQDSGPKPGQQGRIPDRLWARKEFPRT